MLNPTILVVEDQRLFSMIAINLVTLAGFRAIGAVNADEALQIPNAQDDIQLILTDFKMPGSTNGLVLAQFISRRFSKIQLIITSGKAIATEIEQPAGTKFYSKPYDEKRIFKEMKRIIGGTTTSLDCHPLQFIYH